MKKAFFLLAFATLFISACQKEKDPASSSEPKTTQESFTFKASIEGMGADSKGTINASHQMLWATGDKIGIYVNDDGWVDKNQPFTLSEGAGTTEGTFTWDNSGSFSDKATAAFYPWQGTGSDNNNVYGGTMYFKLRESYSSYQSGQMLTPLVASLDNSSSPIHFKHAGAAVKVTVNNLPAGVHSIGMSVDGQQIYGDYSINPSNAGADAITLVGASEDTQNTVWLNFTNGSESKWDFVFPVPEITSPKLSFQMWDENDILVWSKNLKAQSRDLGRGDILVMPPLDITPYTQFDAVDAHWSVSGDNNSWGDTPMVTNGTLCIAKGVSFESDGAFKIRYDGAWETNYGGTFTELGADISGVPNGSNISVPAGEYDIFFNTSNNKIRVVTSKCPYPVASGFGKGSNLHTSQDLTDGGTKDFGTYFE